MMGYWLDLITSQVFYKLNNSMIPFQMKWAHRAEDDIPKISFHVSNISWDLSQTETGKLCRSTTIKEVSDAAQWIWDIRTHIRLTVVENEILALPLKYKVSHYWGNFSQARCTYPNNWSALVTEGSCLCHLHWNHQQVCQCFILFLSVIIQVLLVL